MGCSQEEPAADSSNAGPNLMALPAKADGGFSQGETDGAAAGGAAEIVCGVFLLGVLCLS